MAPQAVPTPTPTTRLTASSSNTAPIFAPLTTIWTRPASCASQIPTVYFGGTCTSTYCSAYPASWISLESTWFGWLSFAYETTSGIVTSTACGPPSTQLDPQFWYSPAIGCPKGFSTALSAPYSSEVSVICCPTAYPYVERFPAGRHACKRLITAPETVSMMARGAIYGTNAAGIITGTYVHYSLVSTTVLQPTRYDGSRPSMYADAIRMVVPFSTTPASASPTGDISSGSPDNPSSGDQFRIGPLSKTYSILVVVGGGIFLLSLLICCCFCCCRSRHRRARYSYSPPVPAPPLQPPPPYTYRSGRVSPTPSLLPAPTPRVDQTRTSVPSLLNTPTRAPTIPKVCPHNLSDECRSTIYNPCCACSDTRTQNTRARSLSREGRCQRYCSFCKIYWNAMPILLCPPEWNLVPRCAHNKTGTCESDRENFDCCACVDDRKEFLDLDFRVSKYCSPCRRAWERKESKDWPIIWGRPVIPKPIITPRPISRPIPTPSPKPRLKREPDPKQLPKDIELTTLTDIPPKPKETKKDRPIAPESDLQHGKPGFVVPRKDVPSKEIWAHTTLKGFSIELVGEDKEATEAQLCQIYELGRLYEQPVFDVKPLAAYLQTQNVASLSTDAKSSSKVETPASPWRSPLTTGRKKSGLLYSKPTFAVPADRKEVKPS